MAITKVKQLIDKLIDSFEGTPWLGEALLVKLHKIDFEFVNTTIHSKNSIAILVQHIINWRLFVIEKLNDNDSFDIEMDSEQDWTWIHIDSKKSWELLKAELVTTQHRLIDILKTKDDEHFLKTLVFNRTYTFEYLIEGIIQHDTYHSGQIGLLYAILKQKKSFKNT